MPTREKRIGHKTLYFMIDSPSAVIMVGCDLFNPAATVKINVTAEQAQRLFDRKEHVQDIVPEMPKELREVFISGTTPAEWDQTMKGGLRPWREYKQLGYVFDHEEVSEAELDQFVKNFKPVRV